MHVQRRHFCLKHGVIADWGQTVTHFDALRHCSPQTVAHSPIMRHLRSARPIDRVVLKRLAASSTRQQSDVTDRVEKDSRLSQHSSHSTASTLTVAGTVADYSIIQICLPRQTNRSFSIPSYCLHNEIHLLSRDQSAVLPTGKISLGADTLRKNSLPSLTT